ncbi:MAG TPA: carboxypeptidase-like regulatory domain-containing protein [Planctomycetota bacterium]|nr:carboxypeptidase-like regulatory domain-containing protein [Planctomycetota bacterium]
MRTAAVLLLGALLPVVGLFVYWNCVPSEPLPAARTTGFLPPDIPPGTIEGGSSIEGRVEASEEGPLPGVEVRALGPGLLRAARTDGSGAFRIEGLPDETFQVVALAPLRPVSVQDGVRPGGAPLLLRMARPYGPLREPDSRLLAKPGTVAGRLTRTDGGPLLGFAAALLLLDEKGEEFGPVEVAPAGFDGFYDFPSVPPGSYRVAVLSTKRAHDARYRFAARPVDLAPAARATVDLSFACADLRGTVRGTGDRPAGGALVRLVLRIGERGGSEAGLLPSGEDGSFRFLELPAGTGEIEVHLPGFETLRAPVELVAGTTREVDLRLRPAGG